MQFKMPSELPVAPLDPRAAFPGIEGAENLIISTTEPALLHLMVPPGDQCVPADQYRIRSHHGHPPSAVALISQIVQPIVGEVIF